MRDDIKAEKWARSLGWDVDKGKSAGDSYTFRRENYHVWATGHGEPEWTRAKLVDGRFCEHKRYPSLSDALSDTSG